MFKRLLKNLENDKKSISFKFNSDLVGLISMNDVEKQLIIEKASKSFAKLLMFYKDDGFKMIRDNIQLTKIIVENKFANEHIKLPEIKYTDFPPTLESIIEGPTYTFKHKEFTISLPNEIDFYSLKYEKFEDYITSQPKNLLKEAYDFINSCLRNQISIQELTKKSYEDIERIVVLAYGLKMSEAIPGSLGRVRNYQNEINTLYFNIVALAQLQHKFYLQMLEQNILVINFENDNILVLKRMSDLFFTNGGTAEVLIGLIKHKSKSRNLQTILNNKELYISKYNKMRANLEMLKMTKTKRIYTEAYLEIIEKLYQIPDLNIGPMLPKDKLIVELHRHIAPMTNIDIAKIKDIIVMIITTFYNDTNLDKFVELMEFYHKELGDTDSAIIANIVMMDFITDMVISNIDVV